MDIDTEREREREHFKAFEPFLKKSHKFLIFTSADMHHQNHTSPSPWTPPTSLCSSMGRTYPITPWELLLRRPTCPSTSSSRRSWSASESSCVATSPAGVVLSNEWSQLWSCWLEEVTAVFWIPLHRADVITENQAKGLGNFVSKFALPALLFKNMVLLDFGDVIWSFLWSVLIAKVGPVSVV